MTNSKSAVPSSYILQWFDPQQKPFNGNTILTPSISIHGAKAGLPTKRASRFCTLLGPAKERASMWTENPDLSHKDPALLCSGSSAALVPPLPGLSQRVRERSS